MLIIFCAMVWFYKIGTPWQILVCSLLLIVAFAGKLSQHCLWVPRIVRFHAADLFVFAGIPSVYYFLLRRFRSYSKSCIDPYEIKTRLVAYGVLYALIFSLIEIFPQYTYGKAGSCDPTDLACYVLGALVGAALVVSIPKSELDFRLRSH